MHILPLANNSRYTYPCKSENLWFSRSLFGLSPLRDLRSEMMVSLLHSLHTFYHYHASLHSVDSVASIFPDHSPAVNHLRKAWGLLRLSRWWSGASDPVSLESTSRRIAFAVNRLMASLYFETLGTNPSTMVWAGYHSSCVVASPTNVSTFHGVFAIER